MSNDDYGRRMLPFPYSYVLNLVEQVEDFFIGDPKNEYGECNVYTLVLTPGEALKLGSVIQAGADLIYPDERMRILNWWWQSGEFVNTYQSGREELLICMYKTFCEKVYECLTTDPRLIQLLRDSAQGEGQNEPITDEELDGNLLPDGTPCADDNLYGIAYYVVDQLSEIVLDGLQRIYLTTLAADTLREVSELIPGVGVANLVNPVANFLDVANAITQYFYVAYEVAVTETNKNELACALWCKMQSECTLTIRMISDVLRENYLTPFTGLNLDEFIAYFVGTDITSWADKMIMALGMSLAVEAIAHGGWFGRYLTDVNNIEQLVAFGADETSNDWTLCNPCPDNWVETIDFAVSDGGFVPRSVPVNGSVWVSSIGWSDGNCQLGDGIPRRGVDIQINFAQNVNMSSVELTYDLVKGVYNIPTASAGNINTSNDTIGYTANDLVDGVNQTKTLIVTQPDDFVVMRMYCSRNNYTTGDLVFTRVTITGTGYNPFA